MTWEELQAVRNHQHCHSSHVIFLTPLTFSARLVTSRVLILVVGLAEEASNKAVVIQII